MIPKSEEDLMNYLKRKKVPDEVIQHILAVTKVAKKIAERLNLPPESKNLVLTGAMLHDVGRSLSHEMDHAIRGAEILKKDGFDERIIRIVERHIGAGLTAEEAKKFGLPEKDYIPETIEEKVVAMADNLVAGSKILRKEEYVGAIEKKFSDQPEALRRHLKLLEEFEEVID